MNLQFFGHTFQTTNTRRPIKCSEDTYIHLVFFSKRNKQLALAVGAQGPMTSAKNAWPYPNYNITHKKNPKLSNFFNPN